MNLEILPQFKPALKQLENFSHITVLFWAHNHGAVEDRSAIDLQVRTSLRAGKNYRDIRNPF